MVEEVEEVEEVVEMVRSFRTPPHQVMRVQQQVQVYHLASQTMRLQVNMNLYWISFCAVGGQEKPRFMTLRTNLQIMCSAM